METQNSFCQSEEATERFRQRELNLSHIRKLRELINGDSSLAHAAFNQLKNNQKRCLFIASQLDPGLTNWNSLTPYQLRKIRVGIKRLKQMINLFSVCDERDFQTHCRKSQKYNRDLTNAKAEVNRHAQRVKKYLEQT